MGKPKEFVPPKCGCGKWRYRNRDQAAAQILWRLARGAPALRIYKCPSGYGFHVTSKLLSRIRGRKVN